MPSPIPQFEIFTVELNSSKTYANPYTDVTVQADFTSPSGRKLRAYGFHDGGSTWRIRLAPDEVGTWSYATAASDRANGGLHQITGSFNCVPSANKGFIRVDPTRKYWFSYSDGSPFFGMGDTCYGMVTCISDRQRQEYLDARAANKFNFIRFFASGYPHTPHPSLADQPYWPWGGTPENPDYDRFNPQFFQRLEGILGELKERGMYAEIEVFNLYMLEPQHGAHNAWFNPPSRREQWVRYLVSRLAAYTTVFLWTIANEYQLYPDGVYRYDGPADDIWVRQMGALIHRYDPHKHPTTVHPEGAVRYPGMAFGNGDEIDVLTQQQNSYTSATWVPEPLPGYYDGPGTEASRDILSDRGYNKPVINTENGYEWLAGFPSNDNRQTHGTDKCRRVAWRIFTAGGAAYAAGFLGTAMGRDNWYRWNRYTGKKDGPLPFVVRDMGLARQLSYYYDFITQKADFRSMDPAMHLVNPPNLCLAHPGREYVVYAPNGGNVTLDLSGTSAAFAVEWLNPREGSYTNDAAVSGGARHTFAAPDNADWVLHLKRLDDDGNNSGSTPRHAAVTDYQVVITAPEDGGFPRLAANIETVGPGHFKIHIPRPEDSHIMVEAVNSSNEVQSVTLEIDPDPRLAVTRWGKEPKSHYYYRTPEGKWFRQHLEEGTPARLVVPLAPGVTRIAGLPFFTYAEYIAYVESLQDPRVQKQVMFTHEQGRFKVYRVTVTNPGGVKDKLRICFARAAHANETSGYYMAQGIIEWLLSGDKAANLDNVEWSFYLCPDPKAIYYHYGYDEIAAEIYDTGKNLQESLADALRAGKHHIYMCEHMWNNEHGGIIGKYNVPYAELESYEYHDPLSHGSTEIALFPALQPVSQVWKDYISYWPHWYEYGTDVYYHRDGRHWDNRIPGMLMMNNEINFYGKDSGGDLIANMKEQGRQWARATTQVYLQFQQRHNYWHDAHPMGPVDTTGAVILPRPEHILLEQLLFLAGNATRKRNADGNPMVIFRKQYDHGLGMKAGESVTFDIPAHVNSFKANVAMDDASAVEGTVQFAVSVDQCEVWRSRPLHKFESQMAHVKLPGRGRLTLTVEGPPDALANWGGAKFTVNDPDMLDE